MYRNLVVVLLSTALIWSGLVTSAAAAVVGTRDAMSLQTREQRIAEVQAGLARADVQQAMIELGVDPLQAQQRVASLDERELMQLQGHLDTAPAGGIFGVIGVVFVVLLILELTGAIDIFKKV
jgi:hypothetical protein